jgi:hypothetical protein
MLDLLYDIHQNAKIAGAEAKADRSAHKVERVSQNIEDIEERLDKLALLNYALWSLLQDKLGVSEAELLARVEELDLQDGKLDGRISGGVVNCKDCDRPLSKRHRKCLYCGFELKEDTAFGSVVR